MAQTERDLEEPKTEDESLPEREVGVRMLALTTMEQQRVKAMQQLANAPDRSSYLVVASQTVFRSSSNLDLIFDTQLLTYSL